mmetsp:Transcript_50271/g.109176  ORF Transcript_50271/g.109176 Transcript_50271/m.109176 type:complete len:437 (+) Transcript_50271:66-1376(+)
MCPYAGSRSCMGTLAVIAFSQIGAMAASVPNHLAAGNNLPHAAKSPAHRRVPKGLLMHVLLKDAVHTDGPPNGEHWPPSTIATGAQVNAVLKKIASVKLGTSEMFPKRFSISPAKNLLQSASESEWAVLLTTACVLLSFDVLVLQRLGGTRRMNFCVLAFWIGVAAAYNAYYWIRYGKQQGLDWCTGYLLEWLLSADNLFVFHLVFKVYSTPAPLMHKALFVGIAGAVIFKMVFFLTLGSLMHAMDWIRFVFGAILIYSGIMAVAEEEEEDPDLSQLLSVRAVKSMLGSRLLPDYDIDGHRLFVSVNGKIYATLLVLVIFILEITDVIFAVDSVSAKVAQIDNQYTAYSSSVMAVFGLRAMFFVLNDLVDCFEHLKIGLCIILIFIGSELMLARWLHLGSGTVCCVIVAVMGACIAASVTKKRGAHKEGVECKLDA